MFEQVLPPVPENPFKSLEGLYEVKYKVPVQELLDPIQYAVSYKLQTVYRDLRKVIELYQAQKPTASLSSILKVLNVSDADLAKLPNITTEETVDVWEVTTNKGHIEAMGRSRHFGSCYSGGSQPRSIIREAEAKGLALVRRLDKNKELKERFLVSADIDVGEGRFSTLGRIRASNYKGPSAGYATSSVKKAFEALVEGKARKLTPEEVANFQWS